MGSSVVLILGGGPNTGKGIEQAFATRGYKIAIASRSRKTEVQDDHHMSLHVDLANPSHIGEAFNQVRSTWGPPNVVVYIGALRIVVDPKDPLAGISLAQYEATISTNLTGALVAMQQAVDGFKQLPPSMPKTFVFTGNKLNRMVAPEVMLFGMTKSAAAHLIWDASVAYEERGFRFYYIDERFENGAAKREAVSGEAAGEVCVQLAASEKPQPWHYTFVQGQGYTDFHGSDRLGLTN